MSAFRVDAAHLEHVTGKIGAFGAALEHSVLRVRGHLDPVYETWTGQAADGHAAIHERWQTAANELHEALQVMRRIADTALANYEASASANVRMWRI